MNSTAPYFIANTPFLAPLAGYSDLAFRLLCREFGCAGAFTEMISAKGLVYNSPGTQRLLDTRPEDLPLIVQLFGSEPEFLGLAMEKAMELGFRYFDLNAGCPVNKVVKTGAGAALAKNPKTLFEIVRTMVRKAGHGHVGVKFRTGWNEGDRLDIEGVSKTLEDIGVGWLTLHPRLASQGYSGQADWSALRILKDAVSIPVIASGDLFYPEDGVRVIEQTGVDTIMFARGALRDPSIFEKYLLLRQNSPLPVCDGPAMAHIMTRHAHLAKRYSNPHLALLKMRTIVPRYLKNLAGSKPLRVQLTHCASWEELDEIISKASQLEPVPQAVHTIQA
ncbi:tRNA dihydrouridine synthase [Desulfovibrio inopinatus]|uniref:tRNA dihydrouridine synthase n=1 Tax=Desulfovibrio inopinatus TaxID=102109 RepID=UPI00040B842C|nr:tRNA-dihydrouridine synthase family protein [Desulfovibrio inopinatus]